MHTNSNITLLDEAQQAKIRQMLNGLGFILSIAFFVTIYTYSQTSTRLAIYILYLMALLGSGLLLAVAYISIQKLALPIARNSLTLAILLMVGSMQLFLPQHGIYILLCGILALIYTTHVFQSQFKQVWLGSGILYFNALIAPVVQTNVPASSTNSYAYALIITLIISGVSLLSLLSSKYNPIYTLRGRLQTILVALLFIVIALMAFLATWRLQIALSSLPQAEMGPILQTQSQFMLDVTIFITLIAIFVSDGVAKLLTQPLQALIKATYRVNQGDLSTEIDAQNTQDELGLLTKQFNELTLNLQKKVSEEQMATTLATQLAKEERASKENFKKTVTQYLSFIKKVIEGDLAAQLTLK